MIHTQTYLYVEDDPLSREAIEMLLKRVLQVKQLYMFEDSTDFIARLKALPSKPNIILLDIHMKPFNGFDMLRMLKQEADYRDIPVIALTASVMNDEVELLKVRGFNGVISKPISVMGFSDTIQRVLAGESVWYVAD